MRILWVIVVCATLMACASNSDDDGLNITSRFNGTWNIHEAYEKNNDGSITYHAISWGGLVASMREHNLPVDWSSYESITVEYVEPTPTTTQLKIGRKMRVYGKPGLSSMVYYFDGQDATQIDDVIIQTADSCDLKVKRVYLTPGASVWNATPIWEGEVNFGNFQNHIIVEAEQFTELQKGDQLEFLYTIDRSDPSIEYWNIKTIYKDTETALDGNADLLNEWGCASLGSSGVFRVRLSDKDIKELRKRGLLVVGFYGIVSKVNILRKGVAIEATNENVQ